MTKKNTSEKHSDTHKTCSICGKKKLRSDFHTNSAKKNKYTASYCKKCNKFYRASVKFGVSVKEIKKLLKPGRCSVCLRKDRILVIDHNHDTGEIRGVLCRQCNSALGLLGDDPVWVSVLLEYMVQQDPTALLRVQEAQLSLLELFSVCDDVFTEPEALSDSNVYKTGGRLYRAWLDTREQLDPEFNREKYRQEQKAMLTPKGHRKRLAGASSTPSTARTQTSAKSRKKTAEPAKRTAKKSAKGARSAGRASTGR